MTTGKWILSDSAAMTAGISPLKRFLLHSLWVVLPFSVLLGLSWNAWRSDANTRRSRLLESAKNGADRVLEQTRRDLGGWSELPVNDKIEAPPTPNDDPSALAARKRYEAGDYEGVLGSPESVRSAAGLPLRALAALQLLRQETDPGRLGELSVVLTSSLDFVSPLFLEEAERRFSELKLPPPPELTNWREQWERAEIEAGLAAELKQRGGNLPAVWIGWEGETYLAEQKANPSQWRVRSESEVQSSAAKALTWESRGLADGLGICLSVDGKLVAGPAGKFPFYISNVDGWRTEVVLADEAAYLRSEIRSRNFITTVIAVAGLAVLFGLVQAGRAYLRAVELARRQSEFMAAVSHEMRTPLAAMRLLAENLESGVADRAGQRNDHTRMIREECGRLGDLVANVLAFTRGGNPEPHEAFDVAAMVADVASLVKPMAVGKNCRFEAVVADFPEPPCGDAAALRRALLNLLDNALKHTLDGGEVACRVRPVDEDRWQIEVCDNGPGVPAHERVRIFDAFYRIGDELRRTTPGTGLGLALVKRTAEAHGGSVEVCDAPEGGACFILSLPIKPPAAI